MWSNKLLIAYSIMMCGVFLDIMVEVDARCVCNAKGQDYCNDRTDSHNNIVRPKPKYFETTPDLKLNPIGDNCWCSKMGIEPAALPKPCPKSTKPDEDKPNKYPCKCDSKSKYEHNPLDYSDKHYSYEYSEPSYVYDTHEYRPSHGNYVPKDSKDDDYSVPADPISISLATQAGKAIEVPEAKLSYGYVQKPVDKPKPIYVSNVPEEKLFKLNSEVITLQKRPYNSYKKEEEEEYMEDPEEEHYDEHGYDEEQPPHLTYKQLGYVTEHYKNPKFRKVSPSSSYYISDSYEYDSEKRSYRKSSEDCGYKPGRVAAYRKGSCDGYST